MPKQRNWTREETLLAFRLYCYTPFGRLHHSNPDIVKLAERLGRTPGAVGMKACNFASLDPLHQARGIVGLSNRSKVEEQIWEEFQHDSEAIADEAEQAHESFNLDLNVSSSPEITIPDGPTEAERTIRARRVQGFFRHAVLTSYNHRCALTGLAIPALLNASHIVPWSTPGYEQHRADPTNGLCLNALHDRAFDRGYISFNKKSQVIVSPVLQQSNSLGRFFDLLASIEGQSLQLPEKFGPAVDAMNFHREHIFQAA